MTLEREESDAHLDFRSQKYTIAQNSQIDHPL